MRKLLLLASLLFCSCASAGTKLLTPTNAPNSNALPATCTKGDIYLYTGATSGQQWYACESANTWVQEGGSGGSGINNQSTLQSNAHFYVEGATVSGNGFVARSTSTSGIPLSLYFRANLTGDQLFIPLFSDVGFGDSILTYLGYNTGGSAGTTGWTFSDVNKNEVAKIQTDGGQVNGIGILGGTPSGSNTTLRVKNTLDDFGSFGVPSAATTVSLTPGSTHFLLLVDATAGALTITLPNLDQTVSNTAERRWYKFCRTDNSGNLITFSKASDDTIDVPDTLDNKGDCMDIIGRVGLAFGSTTAGTWSEVSKTVRGGITGNLNVTGYVHASGVIASEAGTYAYAGTTVTYAAPTIDANDRIPTLNNGAIAWNLAITDAARKDHYNNMTSSTVFVTGSTLAVQGTLLDGTLSAGTSGYVLTSRGPNLPVQFLPGGSGSGYPNPGNADLNIATFNVTNVNNLKFSGTYDSAGNPWVIKPSTFSHVPGGSAGSVTFTGSSSHTVEGLSFWAVANSTFTGRFVLSLNSSSSNSTGFRIAMTGPASPWFFTMTGGGSGASITTSNFSQQAAAINTKNGTALGTYSSGAIWIEFEFTLITGATAGTVNVQLCPNSGAGNNFINSESYITAVKD